MKRTLVVLRLLFAYHWAVAVVSGIVALTLVIGVFAGPQYVIGNFLVAMAVPWASIAFRQFVSNDRLSMLPGFRIHAVAALFMVAAVVGGAATIAAALHPVIGVSAVSIGLLAFALVSAYCLFGQWVATSRAPVLFPLQLLLLLLTVHYVSSGEGLASVFFQHAWALAVAALLGWRWLLVYVQRSARLAGPHPVLRIEIASGISSNQGLPGAMFNVPLDVGRPAHPAGTLVRGGNDGWVNRVAVSLFWIVGFALLWMLWMRGVAATSGGRGPLPKDSALGFLAVSFVATAIQGPFRFCDWPARLRYVWLRAPGDRPALWRMLERAIIAEAVIVAAITAAVSAVLLLASDMAGRLLVAYVFGCTAAMLLGAYAAMGLRISGASMMEVNLYGAMGWAPIIMIMNLAGKELAEVMNGLLVVIVVLALVCRHVARRLFVRMDWCSVKPWREPNAGVRRS